MRFAPRFCPYSDCLSRQSRTPFRWRRKGFFARLCDGRRIQRFHCNICARSFSSQTFRLDYRLRFTRLHLQVFSAVTSKVSMRQTARILGCNRKTVEHRVRLLADHCRNFHRLQMQRVKKFGGIDWGVYQLDELETFETNRRVQPVTVPILIEDQSYFVLHAETAPLPSRGGLKGGYLRQKHEYEKKFGERKNGSRQAVLHTLQVLDGFTQGPLHISSDKKQSYGTVFRQLFSPHRFGSHKVESSKTRRNYGNLLFPINHTLAMMRDGMGCLVRRSWCHAKERNLIDKMAAIWMVWRNYVRGITVQAFDVTPAMALGVCRKQWQRQDLLRWRIFALSSTFFCLV